MGVKFEKYHGTGNDFILIDGRAADFRRPGNDVIKRLCDRRFGIGGDGLIIIQSSSKADFAMKYYNSDGQEGTMCGNGGRCAAAYCSKLGLTGGKARFESNDGIHLAELIAPDYVRLHMQDVVSVSEYPDHFELDTGSPHYVMFVNEVNDLDIHRMGSEIRNSVPYKASGINVNFVSDYRDGIFVRTYERGVEAETWSCGTGVVASAICAAIRTKSDKYAYPVYTLGGKLELTFYRKPDGRFTDIILAGPAEFVFEGTIEI